MSMVSIKEETIEYSDDDDWLSTIGQFYDFINIFETNGYPAEDHAYLFNGDFVDRGSFSVEVILTLFAYKWLYPNRLFLARGNHETDNMNKVYGFEGEVRAKFNETMFKVKGRIPVTRIWWIDIDFLSSCSLKHSMLFLWLMSLKTRSLLYTVVSSQRMMWLWMIFARLIDCHLVNLVQMVSDSGFGWT